MKRLALIVLPALLTAALAAAEKTPLAPSGGEPADAGNGWKVESSGKGVTIHSRTRDGSPIREFRGVGLIEAPPAAVFAVLDDTEAFPNFMPYTAECRVLKREKNLVFAYQRLEFPLVSDRDYTLRSENARWLGPDGPIYRIRWEPANNLGPAVKPGVLRVNVCEGGWLLEPQGSGATRATYSIFTDSGGALPPFVANNGSRIAIRKIFDAVRKQIKDPKYSGAGVQARNTSPR
ncbi:MAG: SRPBCC family protein [Chthoniobacterales bacterium]